MFLTVSGPEKYEKAKEFGSQRVEIRMSEEKETHTNFHEEHTIPGEPASLPLRFRYRLGTGFAFICEVTDRRNNKIK